MLSPRRAIKSRKSRISKNRHFSTFRPPSRPIFGNLAKYQKNIEIWFLRLIGLRLIGLRKQLSGRLGRNMVSAVNWFAVIELKQCNFVRLILVVCHGILF